MSIKDASLQSLKTSAGDVKIHKLDIIEKEGLGKLDQLPFSIRILLETAIRNLDGYRVEEEDIKSVASYDARKPSSKEFPYLPGRVVLQDFTGVPCVVDLAALRSAMVRMKGDPSRINPQVRVDLVIDHSIQVDYFGQNDALIKNMKREFERNQERYEFLKWGQQAFQNFGVVPPGAGIVHQVNLEYLAGVVLQKDGVAFPDSLVGTDSHTTMINGLGVLGWGVGGIEAEAVMLGQPMYMLLPQVVGFKLKGQLPEGATATDLVLTVTQMLRKKGVVEKFVEFYGPGLSSMGLADRATIANMAPEYGATTGFFPVDAETLDYMLRTGRTKEQVDLVEAYYKEQGMFRTDDTPDPVYSDTLELDLSTVEPSLAGPKRPQDRISMASLKDKWNDLLKTSVKDGGYELDGQALASKGHIKNGYEADITHGDVVIAAITSCTNTSNPNVMVGAGLLAKNAVEKGLEVKPYVKTSLAPGSRVVTDYLDRSGLTEYLDKLGFQTVGYGCTTCIGNSGPIPDPVVDAINEGNLVAASVLSGNRNFEGRISPHVKANFLASPPLVVAYALAGTMDIDLVKDPIGKDKDGKDVFLKDIWPTSEEIQKTVNSSIEPDMYQSRYGNVRVVNEMWNDIPTAEGQIYDWQESSTYIQEPPFFVDMPLDVPSLTDIKGARCLVKVADSVTTDHISPAGAIAKDSPAGKYLLDNNVEVKEFNSYGSRRGNDRVMTRGTFANIRLRNQMAPGTEGGITRLIPEGKQMSIYEASLEYKKRDTPLIVLAGAEYGTGSSRDWAAKGTFLLGVRAVIATSFERIHRSNLVGMGVLPLIFKDGQTHESLGLTGEETFEILGLSDDLKPRQELKVKADDKEFTVICRLDNPVEIDYYKNGGILQTVLRSFVKNG
ncbi:MAG: aconitate hydratase AcnA [Spirochaetaceae bacterium]|mgnify:FL=1|nr:aconitate hydratase AcnA [Spirochaetaceae bacterium]|tara:strand:- start:20792 stop:23467 length:2676 start_codon:yes stop_codon:yes gene_type:complete